MIHLNCHTGLGNRVAAMANAMSRDDEVIFHWRSNHHCPVGHEQIFLREIAGVTLVADPMPRLFTRWDKRLAHDWDAAGDRAKADAAYATIMRSMIGVVQSGMEVPSIGVLGRFHRAPGANPAELAARALRICRSHAATSVFLLSDLYRDEIATVIAREGIQVVRPKSKPLEADLVRTARDILDYVADWHMLAATSGVVATNGPASALHPIRASGIPIYYGDRDEG